VPRRRVPLRLPALRLEKVYLALATFALGVALPQILKSKGLEHWTGGVQGIVITKPDAPFGIPSSADQWLYFFTLAVTVAMFVLAVNLLRGRIGLAMVAIRDHPLAASAMGIDLAMYKSLTFGVSAMYTGWAARSARSPCSSWRPTASPRSCRSPSSSASSSAARHHRGRHLRRHLHPVRPERRRPGLEGGAVGDLWHCSHRVHVPDAGRRIRRHPPSLEEEKCLAVPGSSCCSPWPFRPRPLFAQKKYDPGATDTEIKIGQTMPYSGPASAYGTIGRVEAAYFQKVNDEGGVNGRKLKLLSLDDGYSPPQDRGDDAEARRAGRGALHLPAPRYAANSAIHKYLNAKKVPHLFVASGATKWGDPKNFPWTMGWNPSYQTEGKDLREGHPRRYPNGKIAVLYQNDDYGKDLLKGLKDGLGDKAKMIVMEASYEVSDPTVDSQIVSLKGSGADIFVNIATPKFAALAIRKVYDIGWKPVHYLNNVSLSVGSVLTPAGLEKSVGPHHDGLSQGCDRTWRG
jgi:ABC-type branched-subunit amino acid transport system substrate-binding protein